MDSTANHYAGEAEVLFCKADKLEEQGMDKDAFVYMRRAAEMGHPSAQANLGNYYSSGKGVVKSAELATYWYKRAYAQGNDTGAYNLGIDKLNTGNRKGAMVWFERARVLGSGEATLELARLHMESRQGKLKAIALLESTQKMKLSEISEDTKAEAAELLAGLVGLNPS